MWLLENEKAFQGRRLWLRPGKTYLFGRTAAEPGQLAISHNTISRKHVTITVDPVQAGHAERLGSRSRLTIEDLATKIGTVVDGHQIKGAKYVVESKDVDMAMGKWPEKFRIRWFPVVLTFSFTSKELQTQPLTSLRERFENLDIKLSTDYNVDHTTHVVSKKRNTAKGLQALINAKFVVAESFLDAIEQAGAPHADGAEPSALEKDFARCWPDAMRHLPPRGGEPVRHPDSIYAPDRHRKDVFDGYTFIFYDKTQYSNLLAPITNGCGKAMLRTIAPAEEQVDDFVRYVKEVAGEKGLGRFDDGSEGKGVVLVRYLPAKGHLVAWYADFITAVSLRLDHRPIEQNEFLEAILIKDASTLRRPLELESPVPPGLQPAPQSVSQSASPNASQATHPDSQPGDERGPQQHPTGPRRSKPRQPVKRRFAGFDDGDDDDVDMDGPAPATLARPDRAVPQGQEDGGLFVSPEPDASEPQPKRRRASPLPEDDLMDGMAPAAARFKRQRLERGDAFASPSPEPVPAPAPPKAQATAKKPQEMDVLALAARHREQEEARARAEEDDLAKLPGEVDLAEIRRLHIVEEMEVRRAPGPRTRELDVADGRWNARWNGVKNFKRFRRRGEPVGRQPARVIVPLAPVKIKEFGVGDNYWLEDQGAQPPPAKSAPAARSPPPVQEARRPPTGSTGFALSDDDESNGGKDTGRSVAGGTSAAPSQRHAAASQSRGKRPAQEPASAPRSKRPRRALRSEAVDSDDSDDELKFRFGRRR